MGTFNKYIEIENHILRKKYLINKFFNGKSLEERTKIENIDYFTKYCGGENTLYLLGNNYCPGALSNNLFNCPYLSYYKDHNNLKTCMYHDKKH